LLFDYHPKEVYLPKGTNWYNFWTNKIITGKEIITEPTSLETIPIYVRAGSFIPMANYHSSTDFYSTEELTIQYYHDSSTNTNTYTMFDDDGATFGTIQKGEFRLLQMKRVVVDENEISYVFNGTGDGYTGEPMERNIKLKLIGIKKSQIQSFKINDNQLDIISSNSESINGYYFDKNNSCWIINFLWDGNQITINQINN